MKKKSNTVLIIGSAPDAKLARSLDKSILNHIVAINNAWQIRDDWDFLIHPEDFSAERLPSTPSKQQTIITAQDYVGIQNNYGGFVYAGGTMAFTAAYWALGQLKPSAIAFIGCDMVYTTSSSPSGAPTHFYGTGKADPLRQDVSLQSLEAKSARLLYMAHQQQCCCVNLSALAESRLVFPRVSMDEMKTHDVDLALANQGLRLNKAQIDKAIKRELALDYYFESGRYWDYLDQISADECLALDQLWLASYLDHSNENSTTA